jgi:hypothetical protein
VSEHTQVAAYALGLLDLTEMSQFEDHLVGCEDCAVQLETLLPVADRLAEVEPGDVFDVDGPTAFGPPSRSAVRPLIAPAPPVPPAAPIRPVGPWATDLPNRRAATDGPATTRFPVSRFPNDRAPAEQYPAEQYPPEQYPPEQYPANRYPAEQPPAKQHPAEQYPADRYPAEQYPTDRYPAGQYPAEQYPRDPAEQYPRDRYPGDSGPPTGGSRTIEPRGDRERSRRVPLSRPPGHRPAPAAPPPRRHRGRGLLIASAAAILGVLAGAGAVITAPWAKPDPGIGTAIGKTSDKAGDKVSAVDPSTGVHADAVLESKPWGTLVSFDVSDIDGPRNCRLVAVRADGQSEVLSSWTVPEQGYGAGTEPPKLALTAATAIRRQDIAALRVQDIGLDGGGTSDLVTVPT